MEISIHAAREGGDIAQRDGYTEDDIFQSTPPVKAATAENLGCDYNQAISIHAAREGGDWSAGNNPQSKTQFQSTPPVKAATTRRH